MLTLAVCSLRKLSMLSIWSLPFRHVDTFCADLLHILPIHNIFWLLYCTCFFFSLSTYNYLYSIFQFVFIVCFVYAFDVMLCHLFIKRIMEYTEKSLQYQRSILINRRHQLHERCERKLSIMVDLLPLKHNLSVVIENLGKLNHVFKLLMEVNQLTYWQSMVLRCRWEIIFT